MNDLGGENPGVGASAESAENAVAVHDEAASVAHPASGASISLPTGQTFRPDSLLRGGGVKFVNKMRNVGWIAGFAQPLDDSTILLQQTNNIETAIRVKINTERYTASKLAGRALTVQFHVRGYRDQHGPQAGVHAIALDRPSVLDLPAEKVWLSGFGKSPEHLKALREMAREGFSPFDEHGRVKAEFAPYLAEGATPESEQPIDPRVYKFVQAVRMFGDLLEVSGGVVDSRLGRGQNYVTIAGFVDAKAYVRPTEHRPGYGLLLIRQHADPNENIPVRVTDERAMALMQNPKLREGMAVVIDGTIRRKVYPKDDAPQEVASAHTYIECGSRDIKPAVFGRDILETPLWWGEIHQRLLAQKAEREARKALAAQAQAAQSAPKPQPSESSAGAIVFEGI